jgi:hypothetical protein
MKSEPLAHRAPPAADPRVRPDASAPPSRWPLSRWVDSLGSVGAFLCAVHCALLPFALVLLPMVGFGILASATFERGFVLFATALAIASLWNGHRRHRRYRAMAILAPGLVLLWAGILVPRIHEGALLHAVAMSIGGSLVALAHLANLRLTELHVHDEHSGHA